MAKVSIIVAAYNVEEYIREAMDSAVNQTMQDIEIIAVDDHSTDGTAEILQEYAAKDSRVKVIVHEENKSLLAVRHTGVMAATGEYALFLDGDDYLLLNACECLYQDIVVQKLDVLSFCGIVFSDDKAFPLQDLLEISKNHAHIPAFAPKTRAEIFRACFKDDPDIRWNLWGKMYSTQLLKKVYGFVQSERVYMAEDLLMFFMIACYAHSFGYKSQSFYCYRLGSGISTTLVFPTVQKLEGIATEYQVHSLLCKWIPKYLRRGKYISRALSYVRAKTRKDVFHYFVCRARLEDCPVFLQAILQYCTLEAFVNDLTDFLLKERVQNLEDVALRLRGGISLSAKSRSIKTVASFYYRLSNGGIERVICLLASIWQAAGYRVVIVTEEEPSDFDYPLPKDVQRAVLPKQKGKTKNRMRSWTHIIQEYHIDAVVYHAWIGKNRFWDALAVKSQGIPFILHTHGLSSQEFNKPEITKIRQEAIDALSDIVITLSEEDQAWWEALGYQSVYTLNPLTYQPTEVVPATLQGHNGIWIGRLSPEKQYYDAFEIARLVRKKVPDFRLHIIGKAENNNDFLRIQQYLADHNMSGYILLHGYHTNVAPFFQSASVMLFTSILAFEGAPMSIMEGKVFGVPLVTYELASVSAIRAGKGMFIVNQNDYYTAAGRIVQLLQNEELRHKISAEARQSAEEIARFDFIEHWRGIFELSIKPHQFHTPLYQLPPLCSALRTATRLLDEGIANRAKVTTQVRQSVYNDGFQQLAYENAAYATMVEEIKSSTSYKIGRLLTFIPRKLKNIWLSIQK